MFKKCGDMMPNEVGLKNIKVLNVENCNDYLFITLDNGQKILTNGTDVYDVSIYSHISNLFNMGDRLCAVLIKGYSRCVLVDLKAMEVLFEDDKASFISKQDDNTIHVIKKIGCGNNTIYNIDTKKYLPLPEDYEFENALGNNLYVFREKGDLDSDFYDYKRCVIDVSGNIVLKDISGYIELCGDYLIINKRNEFSIVKRGKDNTPIINTITQNNEIIAKPEYHDGHIIIMEKGLIKIYTLDLELVNKFEMSELDSVIDFERVSNILKICLPYEIDGKEVDRHIFLNLKSGKMITHIRILGYPHWTPEVFVAKDSLNDEKVSSFEEGKIYDQTEYHFYDSSFDKIDSIKGNSYYEIDDYTFMVSSFDGEEYHRKFINAKTRVIKDCNYSVIKFSSDNIYGYGLNTITDMVDIIDRNLNVIIPNIDYHRLDLNKHDIHDEFNCFVVNEYVCIITCDKSKIRYVIQKASGEIILDSKEHNCYPMGDLIKIVKDNKSEFLNTVTGQFEQLSLTASTDENGKISFNEIRNTTNLLLPQSSNVKTLGTK